MATEDTKSKRRTAKTIRNLTNKLVHLRLTTVDSGKDPYRVELKPRGRFGDWATIPAALTESGTFLQGADQIFEIIPLSEARKIDYASTPGYQPHQAAEVVRPDQNTIASMANPDAAIQASPRSGVPIGPRTVNVPGSDAELNAAYQAGTDAMPEGALKPRVTTERVKG